MAQPLLSGHTDDRDAIIRGLKAQVAELQEELTSERQKSAHVEPVLRKLRQATLPFFQLLSAIHGEIDSLGIEDNGNGASANPTSNSKWDAIKARNPGKIAEAIDVMLIQGTVSINTLRSALRISYDHCRVNVVYKMKALGLLVKNGRDYSLKNL